MLTKFGYLLFNKYWRYKHVYQDVLIFVCLCNVFIRERPFNLRGGGGYGFLFRSEFFFRTTQDLE
jgi:hypothetical protein